MLSRRLAALAAAAALCLAVPSSRAWSAAAEPETFPESGKASPSPVAGGPVMNRGDLGWRGTTLQTRMAPPDPHVAAGPEHVVLITNEQISFYTKAGKQTFRQNIKGSNGFWGSLGAIPKLFDPEVHWDPWAKRFLAFANGRSSSINNGRSYFMLAVSDDTNPNGKWHLFRFDVTALASVNNGGAGDIDSPNLGLDKNVLYMTADFQFGGAGARHLIYMVEKQPLLSGKQPTKVRSMLRMGTRFWGVPVVWGPAPAMYMVEQLAPFNGSSNKLRLHAITSPLTTPKLTSFDLTVPTYRWPAGVYAKGSRVRVSPGNSRIWSCVWRNGFLWCCHHVGSPTVKSRWYQIATLAWPAAGSPKLLQQGTVDMGSGIHTFYNAIHVDAQNNALMVFSMASTNSYISIGRTWRKATDPPGTMRPPRIVQANTAPYSIFRWGDYASVSPDPVEPNTMWYVHEYAATQNVWTTWIGRKVTAPLAAYPRTISVAGGSIGLYLDNPSHKLKPYLMLMSATGTKPGFPLGSAHVPLNVDALTLLVLPLVNTAPFQGFLGTLDKDGLGVAKLTVPPVPGLVGLKLWFAYVQDGTTWDFASNAVQVTLVK